MLRVSSLTGWRRSPEHQDWASWKWLLPAADGRASVCAQRSCRLEPILPGGHGAVVGWADRKEPVPFPLAYPLAAPLTSPTMGKSGSQNPRRESLEPRDSSLKLLLSILSLPLPQRLWEHLLFTERPCDQSSLWTGGTVSHQRRLLWTVPQMRGRLLGSKKQMRGVLGCWLCYRVQACSAHCTTGQ